jgi:hypothetical protein
MSKRWLVLLSLAAVMLMAACAGPTEYIVVDEREVLGNVFTEQTGNVDNSNSAEFLAQDLAVRREFRHRIDLRMNQSASLDRRDVEERVLATYDLPDAVGEKICIVLADVPPGAVYQYEIEWTQVLREGNIEEGNVPGQGNILGEYTIITDLQCQTIGVTQVN